MHAYRSGAENERLTAAVIPCNDLDHCFNGVMCAKFHRAVPSRQRLGLVLANVSRTSRITRLSLIKLKYGLTATELKVLLGMLRFEMPTHEPAEEDND